MEKLLVISLLAIVGCTEPSKVNIDRKETTYMLENNTTPLEIVIIDSCEYLYGDWERATVLTHKGNCKHCKNN
jgi:hypothetical protein